MCARDELKRVGVLALAGLSLCAAAPVCAQEAPGSAAANDMAMPDDLGKPLEGMIPMRRAAPASSGAMGLDTPVGEIASDPRGRAILEKDLPGLCERPEYVMFKGMSLRQLQPMSKGKLTKADLDQVQADLAAQRIAVAAPRRTHNPLVVGGRAVERVTHAIYKRVVLVVASL